MWCRRPHEMTWVGNTQAAVGRLMTDGAYADDRPRPAMTGRGPKGTARRNTTSSQRAPADASACPLGARVLDERRPGGASSMRPRLWPLGPCYLSDTSLIALPFHVTVSV